MNSIPVARRKSGFTLIELLVVIAIIAILAAILFPVFARARENARRASCQSNEKNIALGFKQYIQDNGEKYPPRIKYAPDLMSSAGGTGALAEYIKSTAIFICPSDSAKNGSYAYLLQGAPNESSLEPTATTELLKETSGTRHFDGQNIAYADGHVKWAKGEGGAGTAPLVQATSMRIGGSTSNGAVTIPEDGCATAATACVMAGDQNLFVTVQNNTAQQVVAPVTVSGNHPTAISCGSGYNANTPGSSQTCSGSITVPANSTANGMDTGISINHWAGPNSSAKYTVAINGVTYYFQMGPNP